MWYIFLINFGYTYQECFETESEAKAFGISLGYEHEIFYKKVQ